MRRAAVRTYGEHREQPDSGETEASEPASVVDRALGVSSMRALGVRSSYEGRTVDA